MRFRAVLFMLCVGVAVRGVVAPATPEAVLLVLGDQHSAYEGAARLVGFVDRLKAERPGLPVAILLNGDTQEYGNALARRTEGRLDFAIYAALARRAPTIVNLGNHEADFLTLDETVRRMEAAGVTVIGNLVNRATGEPFAPARRVVRLGREAATVVGLTTDNLSTYRVAVRPTLELPAPAAWARANLPVLLQDAALPVVLSHAGIAADRQVREFVPDGTLFAGAHDHQRFVVPFGRTVYFHSGSWNSHVSLAWLGRDDAGRSRWTVEQVALDEDVPSDPELLASVKRVFADHLTAEDRAVVAKTARAHAPPEAARAVVGALRDAARVDAAFIGNTTFGAGLPAGDVSRLAFDACVRFDGPIFVTEVDGARLAQLLAVANLTPGTPFAERRGEFNYAAGPAAIDPQRIYRIATTDWGAKNTARYFGEPALDWREEGMLRLKAAALAKLAAD